MIAKYTFRKPVNKKKHKNRQTYWHAHSNACVRTHTHTHQSPPQWSQEQVALWVMEVTWGRARAITVIEHMS